MKRALVASILGIAATTVSSYGQASFYFSTYNAAPNYGPVKWTSDAAMAPANMAGLAVTDSQSVLGNIIWSYGGTTGDAGLALPTVSIPGYGSGFFNSSANITTAADYVTGTPITFTIQVWAGGASFNDPADTATGSLTWTETAGFISGGPPQTFASFPAGLTIALVPEPTTLALAGLGALGLMFMRRRS